MPGVAACASCGMHFFPTNTIDLVCGKCRSEIEGAFADHCDEPLRDALEFAADELDAARKALIEHGCNDDNLKNCERAAFNARNAARARAFVGDANGDLSFAMSEINDGNLDAALLDAARKLGQCEWPMGGGSRCSLVKGHPGPHQTPSSQWPNKNYLRDDRSDQDKVEKICGAQHPDQVWVHCSYLADHGGVHARSINDPTYRHVTWPNLEKPRKTPSLLDGLKCPRCGTENLFHYSFVDEIGASQHAHYVCTFWSSTSRDLVTGTGRCGWHGWRVPDETEVLSDE